MSFMKEANHRYGERKEQSLVGQSQRLRKKMPEKSRDGCWLVKFIDWQVAEEKEQNSLPFEVDVVNGGSILI